MRSLKALHELYVQEYKPECISTINCIFGGGGVYHRPDLRELNNREDPDMKEPLEDPLAYTLGDHVMDHV